MSDIMDIKKSDQIKSTHVAIFASGAGTNAEKIIEHFKNSPVIISLVISNNPSAGVLNIAQKEKIPFFIIEKKFFIETGYLKLLEAHRVTFIVLAGFLWKIPPVLIHAYPDKIINIHPALLPKFGGKGMYGNFVHEAVIANNEKESGITIHYVDELYDHGRIIFQAKCLIAGNDDAKTLAKKIHQLEHENYPAIIEKVITDQ